MDAFVADLIFSPAPYRCHGVHRNGNAATGVRELCEQLRHSQHLPPHEVLELRRLGQPWH